MDDVLRTDRLTKRYGHFGALNALTMRVPKGAIYGLVGKNGAGKTTLMRLICGLQAPTSGGFSLYGVPHDSGDIIRARRRMGVMVEGPAIYGDMTAAENLMQQRVLLGLSSRDGISERLQAVGLEGAGRKKARHFSLGMKQRLGLAIAMLGDPEFLILDEPVNGLDPAGIRDVRDTIRRLNQEGVTILISSHLLDELSKVATKYGILNDGKLVEEITTEELEERCRHNVTMIVDDPVKAKQLLTEMIPAGDLSVEQHKLTVYSHTDQAAAFNRKLVSGGVDVFELTTHTRGVEDFFIERIGG